MVSTQGADNEDTPLLGETSSIQNPSIIRAQVPSSIARKLYVSHFLSTWNSRVFEFGAVLYLASIFPGTLLPMSVYALVRGLSAVVLAPAVGQYIDTHDRLQVVRVSISKRISRSRSVATDALDTPVFQRLAVAASCAVFLALVMHVPIGYGWKMGLLAALSFLACIEKLCSIMNLVSVEKDWVVVIAGSDQGSLRTMNAQMRRIDLICKLLGPLFIGLVDDLSTKVAITVNLIMNIASLVIEYFTIAQTYRSIPELQEPKRKSQARQSEDSTSTQTRTRDYSLKHNLGHIAGTTTKSARDFWTYFHHRAFLPSFAGALLYLTVLNFAGQMVTYLLSAGYTATEISIARTLAVSFEVLATWVAPWLTGRIGPVRAGLWLSSLQVTTLIAGTVVFWAAAQNPLISVTGLVVGTILSRVGLRGFDLCVQIIVQEDVEAESRGAFSSVEAAFQNVFELLSYATTLVFFRPEQFRWPALVSTISVMLASLVFTIFVYLRRGHLLHVDALLRYLRNDKEKQRHRDLVIQRITSEGDA